jgi:hypothetical protein
MKKIFRNASKVLIFKSLLLAYSNNKKCVNIEMSMSRLLMDDDDHKNIEIHSIEFLHNLEVIKTFHEQGSPRSPNTVSMNLNFYRIPEPCLGHHCSDNSGTKSLWNFISALISWLLDFIVMRSRPSIGSSRPPSSFH